MKQTKFLLLGIILLIGTTFTSCLNGDSENLYDIQEYVTVNDGSIFGGVTLVGDFTGYTYIPTNPEILRKEDLSYPERAYLQLKLVQGEAFSDEKTQYKVTIYQGMRIDREDFNTMPDTLDSYKIKQLGEPWIATNAVNLNYTFNYSYNAKAIRFDMFPTSANGDVLNLKLNFSLGGGENAYEEAVNYSCFKLAGRREIQEMLDERENGGELVVPQDDSVRIVVWAEGPYAEKLQTKPIKVKLSEY